MDADFIIIGGGAAGSVLANRLSADPGNQVILVEAGGKGTGALTWVPFGMLATVPGHANNWRYRTVPQAHMNGRVMYQPRGRNLGGSTAINAMICTRGVPADYDGWGLPGWGFADLLPHFKASEAHHGGGGELRGGDGPQPVSRLQGMRPASGAFLAAGGTLQYPKRDDFNDGTDTYGLGAYEVFQKNGERWSAARSYLSEAVRARPNLRLLTHARFLRLTLAGRQATGAIVRHRGKDVQIHARREVILSGGAFGSPHMLQLSGIGDAAQLRAAGLPVVHDLPSVGKNLSDHLDVKVYLRDFSGQGVSLNPRYAARHLIPGFAAYLRRRQGPLATNFAEVGGFAKSGLRGDLTDLQFHLTCAGVFDHGRKMPLRSFATLNICNLYPHARGTVRAATPDPLTPPDIDPRYLSDPRDMALMCAALEKGLQIAGSETMRTDVGPIYRPTEPHDAQAYIRETAQTIYHPVGTCALGQVVDLECRVQGMGGLRVVDASLMPTLNGGNTTAPTLAIAERAAGLILNP